MMRAFVLLGNTFLVEIEDIRTVYPACCPYFSLCERNIILSRTKKIDHLKKMNFLPATPLYTIPTYDGAGGIAINVHGTVCASVNCTQHCVYIYRVNSAGVCSSAPLIIGAPGTAGSLPGQLKHPGFACFVHRNGSDTLLICDWGNDRVVEVTTSGEFCRAIAVKSPLGVAYCSTNDVIAVSLHRDAAVVLLQYESGAVKPEVTIGSGTYGGDDGQLRLPMGVAFTADSRFILVADWGNHRVSKFSAANGAFLAHVATNAGNGIRYPSDVIDWEGDSIVVAYGYGDGDSANVLFVRECGVDFMMSGAAGVFYSASFKGAVAKHWDGSVYLFRDAWMASSRCAWLSALSCV
jgi:hypothetical protein